MTLSGWIVFIISNLIVISLVSFCFYRVFAVPKEHMHAPLEIDTKDLRNGDNGNGENGMG